MDTKTHPAQQLDSPPKMPLWLVYLQQANRKITFLFDLWDNPDLGGGLDSICWRSNYIVDSDLLECLPPLW